MRPRVPVATTAGLLFLGGWIAGAMLLGDRVRNLPAAVQFLYYATAGFVWVFPVRWLMLWGAYQR